MFIDTHCHLSIDDYDDIEKVIFDNRNAGISKIIISGCTKDSIVESLELSKKYDDVFVTIGYHPSETDITTDDDLLFLEECLKNNKVVGIGEIGLDYHYGKENKDDQIVLFKKQLDLAKKYTLPVVIHSRDAVEDTIKCLSEYDLRGDIHCFSGSVETAKIYVSMGYVLGIGGVVTFKNSNLFKVVENVGIDNIVLETDSPYLSPEPFRGTKNSSKNIPIIAQKIAEILNISAVEVANTTFSNAVKIFDL